MTTVKESPNGHSSFPPPFSVENPDDLNRADLPTNKANNNQFPASAYHVPPKRFAPKAYPYCHDDFLNLPPETEPQPERCQFMFSDGRQCTMARSDIHPSLCTYHSDREEQLFGDPSCRCEARTLDFPELYSACRDLTTAAGVNRALGQVFRLLAQRRISRQEAATFGHLAQLLLRTISLTRAESSVNDDHWPENGIILSEQRRIPQNGSHSVSLRSSGENDNPTSVVPRNEPERATSSECVPQYKNGSSARESAASNPRAAEPTGAKDSLAINTCADSARNSPEISTYEIVELKTVQNQHLHLKNDNVRFTHL